MERNLFIAAFRIYYQEPEKFGLLSGKKKIKRSTVMETIAEKLSTTFGRLVSEGLVEDVFDMTNRKRWPLYKVTNGIRKEWDPKDSRMTFLRGRIDGEFCIHSEPDIHPDYEPLLGVTFQYIDPAPTWERACIKAEELKNTASDFPPLGLDDDVHGSFNENLEESAPNRRFNDFFQRSIIP